jgi:hypothetical protein
VPKPLAIWNSARDVWEKPDPPITQPSCGHLDVFSATFPTSGMTVNGEAFALPKWEHAIPASESLSLLRTVVACEAGGGPQSPAMARQRGQTLRLSGQMIDLVNPGQLPQPSEDLTLLRTPMAQEGRKASTKQGASDRTGHHLWLTNQVADMVKLLPTVTVQDGDNNGGPAQERRKYPPLNAKVKLLPTVRTSDTNGAGKHGDGGLDLRTTVSLLPSPRATDGEKGGPNQRGSKGDLMLPSAVVKLLPTPKAQDGQFASPSTSGRPVEKSTHLGTIALLQTGHLEHRRSGANTSQPSDAGNESSDGQLPPPPNPPEETERTG